MTPLEACVATFRRWLYLPDPGALYITLAAVAANLGPGDPVWLLMIGPPGGGKTEVLAPLTSLDNVHPTATLTEAALLSGTPRKEREAGAKGGLLREIGSFGIIVCKDFGSVLNMHRDARAAVMAALREVYDGSWTRHVGTGGGKTLAWEGKVGLIAGCTPAIDSHHAVMGSMGERFVLYRLPKVDDDQQAGAALAHVGREPEMRAELTSAVGTLIAAVDRGVLGRQIDPEDHARLVALATLAVRCRSAVERDSYHREIELIPEPEAPGRLALVLLRLLNGLTAIGVDQATAWQLITKAALDSMPAVRRIVLEAVRTETGPIETSALAKSIGYPKTTARRALEDLAAHGILASSQAEGGNSPMFWTLTGWARSRWPNVPETSGGVQQTSVPETSGVSFTSCPEEREDFSGTLQPLGPLDPAEVF